MEFSGAWRAARHHAMLISLVAITTGCGPLVPTPTPDPTHLGPLAGTDVEVAVDNRSDEPMTMTLSQPGEGVPSLTVGPCEAGNFFYPMQGPFAVGLGSAADFAERPMPQLVESSALRKVDGVYRLLIRVGPDGEVEFGPLEGAAPMRGAGC